MDLVIKGGVVVSGLSQHEADLGIECGRVVQLAAGIDPGRAEVLDASGHYVLPGVVDLHTHLDGGAAGFESGSRAAVWGGVTTVVDFAPQTPGKTLEESLAARREALEGHSLVDWSLHAAPTEWNESVRREIRELIGSKVPSFAFSMADGSLPGVGPLTDAALFELIEETAKLGGTVLVAAGNRAVSGVLRERLKRDGLADYSHQREIHHPALEADGIRRAAAMAEMVNGNVFFMHLTSMEAIEALAQSRDRGVNVSGETAPHYLLRQALGQERAALATMPPLRTTADAEALWHAMLAGTIEVVSSGHRVSTAAARLAAAEVGLVEPNLAGLELMLPLLFSEGVRRGRMTVTRLAQVLCSHPAMVAGLFPAKGILQVGSDADVVVLDPEREWTLEPAALHATPADLPWERLPMRGAVVATVLRGKVLRRGEELTAQAGYGRYLERHPLEELY